MPEHDFHEEPSGGWLWLRRFFRSTSRANAWRQAEQLRVTLRSIGDAVIATDAQGRITFLNPVAEELTKWSTSEAAGKTLEEVFVIFNEQTGQTSENPVGRVLRENKVVGLANHTVLRARDGREIPIEDSAAPIRGDAGDIQGVILVFHDVTEARAAQREIRESRERMQAAMTGAGAGTFRWDIRTNALEWDDNLDRLFGLAPGETIRSLEKFIATVHPDERAGVIERCERCAREGADFDMEFRVIWPDGSEHWLHDRGKTFSDAEGKPLHMTGACVEITDRKRSEESLGEARARLEAALQVSEIATWTWDIQNNRVMADKNLARFFSVTPEDAAGGPIEHYTRAIHPEDRARVEAVVAEALKSERGNYEMDYRLVQPDGAPRWVAARGKVEHDAEGKPVRFPGVVIDITARKQAEAAQAAQMGVLGLIAEGAPLAETLEALVRMTEAQASTGMVASILLIDEDGLHLRHGAGPDLSAAYNQAIAGVEIDASVGSGGTAAYLKKSVRVTDIATDPLWKNFAELALSHGLKACWSTPIVSSQGRLLGTFALFYAEAREPGAGDERLVEMATRTAAIAIERNHSEEALRASAERFRFLAESMPQKIFTAKPNGDVDYFNRQWLEFTGLSFEQIREWGWLQFIHPEDVDENIRRWQHSIDTGEPFYLEHRFLRVDGQYRWHVSRAVPMRDTEGKTIMWIGSNTDIEEVRQAKEVAERASRSKDEFLAALSHELRTPLTPVLMTAATLRNETRLPLDVREQLGMIQRNIELEARLIDDLLDLTRIARGKLQLRSQPCDAHSLVALSIEMVRSEASRKRQTMEIDLAAQHSRLLGDPARLQQVFWNLLKNAVKFTPESGQLAVRSRDGDGTLTLEISDTGIGFEAEAIERIFLPFEQAAALTGEHRFGGLGLGLAISKAVVDLHGGRIQAQSAGPGKGAVFRVELPVPEDLLIDNIAPGSAETNGARPAQRARFTPLRLLLVEDHEPTLAVLERLLTRAGHSVATAMSVAGALQTASGPVTFDALVSDVGLPDGTGFELMEKLRTTYELRGIALSGYGMDEDLRRSREAGFSTHLTKPIDFAQLEQALADLTASHGVLS